MKFAFKKNKNEYIEKTKAFHEYIYIDENLTFMSIITY